MAQRDYVSRRNGSRQKKKSTGINKTLLILIGLFILLSFIFGLFWLKQKAPEVEIPTRPVEIQQPKSVLPSRPEEVWSYIQDLETREIPIDNSPSSLEKNAQLTAEQKKILALLEQDQQNAQKAKASESVKSVDTPTTVVRQQNKEVNVVEAKPEAVKPVTQPQPSQPQAVPETKVVNNNTESKKGFGLQCGAFKNKQQAENLQARLAMAGFNSRVSASADWNRVFVGPVGDRNAAIEAQARAKSITNCVVINM
ncbi:cell division protein FtsN [Volucribacter amazonae]|uniref:Cell division protein FtsN n=1 Tax=Volucribacter amazonae TaxID=256731 RepID=A0A9X4SID8_9PAST|nr:cell division protein FtsN [Volucribacter amazonae]MDG6895515.1 hypothetical protein [Volucribacter amazonae]